MMAPCLGCWAGANRGTAPPSWSQRAAFLVTKRFGAPPSAQRSAGIAPSATTTKTGATRKTNDAPAAVSHEPEPGVSQVFWLDSNPRTVANTTIVTKMLITQASLDGLVGRMTLPATNPITGSIAAAMITSGPATACTKLFEPKNRTALTAP